MAHTSKRFVSRAVSPPKSTAKTAGVRVTRSQSHDLGDNSATGTSRQDTRRAFRQESVESIGSETSKSNRRRKASRAPVIATNLSIVEEDVAEGAGQQDKETSSTTKSIPSISKASKIRRSAAPAPASQELFDLNTDLIIEALPSLDKYSDEIIKQIPVGLTLDLITNIRNLLAISNSKLAKRMRDFGLRLEASKANFGDGIFIDNDFILQKLFGTQNPEVNSGRPDAIVYKANIAVLFENLLAGEPEVEFMMNLDEAFPIPFTGAYYTQDNDSNGTWQETFYLALEIRTQFAIILFQEFQGRDDFDPDSILAQIFYQDDEESSAEEILREGKPKSIAGLNLVAADEQSKRIADRIDEIRQAEFDDTQAHITKAYIDLDELRRTFPWEGFLFKIIEWMQKRSTDYDHTIEQEGGAEKIIEALWEEIPNSDHDITLNLDPPPPTTSQLSPTNYPRGESEAEKRKRLMINAKEISKLSFRAFTRPPNSPEPSIALARAHKTLIRRAGDENPRDDGALNIFGAHDGFEREQVSQPPEVRKSLETWNRVEEEKNKENNRPVGERYKLVKAPPRFLDSQAGAKKARFETAEDGVETAVRVSKPSRKRSREDAGMDDDGESVFSPKGSEMTRDTEDTNSEDEGFEVNQREATSKRRRMQREDLNTLRAGSKRNSNQRRRQPETDEDHDDEDIAPPSQSYENINTQAKRRVAQSKPRTIQTRIPWTSAECDALVDLIGEHGNGWSNISASAEAAESIQERHRDQVALRDKARNIKVNYLLSGSALPSKFDMILLGPKEKNKVIKAGFNPYRREGEEVGEESIDENGEPYE